MWKLAVLSLLASVFLQMTAALGGAAESLAFPGYLPGDYVKARKPIGDGRPNDVYQHLGVRGPELGSHEVVIYPHHFGFEYGQDPEHSIYEVHNAKELQAAHSKKHGKKHNKHGKHGKHAHHHDEEEHHHHHHHHDEDEHHHHHHHENQVEEVAPAPRNPSNGYGAPPPPPPAPQQKQQFRPRPAFPPVHAHFG